MADLPKKDLPEKEMKSPPSSAPAPDTDAQPAAADTPTPASVTNGHPATQEEASKKTSRLQWDEENLTSNALEMERAGPRMKIDEPKTPFVQGSENGSSTSGSAHQSPPESPSFIPGERLVGFHSLEASMQRGGTSGGASSDGASSAGSAGRSVHIVDDAHSSGGSSPRSKELFKAKRKAHYRNEAARFGKSVLIAAQLDEEGDEGVDADDEGAANGHVNGEMNGTTVGVGQSVRARVALLNGEPDMADGGDEGGGADD